MRPFCVGTADQCQESNAQATQLMISCSQQVGRPFPPFRCECVSVSVCGCILNSVRDESHSEYHYAHDRLSAASDGAIRCRDGLAWAPRGHQHPAVETSTVESLIFR